MCQDPVSFPQHKFRVPPPSDVMLCNWNIPIYICNGEKIVDVVCAARESDALRTVCDLAYGVDVVIPPPVHLTNTKNSALPITMCNSFASSTQIAYIPTYKGQTSDSQTLNNHIITESTTYWRGRLPTWGLAATPRPSPLPLARAQDAKSIRMDMDKVPYTYRKASSNRLPSNAQCIDDPSRPRCR
jgi:hypothetical protein